MAATFPVSCTPREDKPLLPAEDLLDSQLRISPSYLGLKFLLTAVKIIIMLPSMFHTHYLNLANFRFSVLVFLQPGAELL